MNTKQSDVPNLFQTKLSHPWVGEFDNLKKLNDLIVTPEMMDKLLAEYRDRIRQVLEYPWLFEMTPEWKSPSTM